MLTHIFSGILILVTANLAMAQGLDGLKPESDSKAAEKLQEASEKADDAKKAVDTIQEKAAPKETQVKRSELSKKLDNKLKTGTAFMLGLSMSGPSGEYTAGGVGEVYVLYRLDKKVYGFELFGSGRFAATDFTATIDEKAYRGVIENYQGGVTGERKLTDSMTIVAVSELSYQINWLDSIDGQVMPDGTDANGFGLNLAASVVWTGFDGKVSYGPKLGYTAGSYSYAQFGGEINFVF